MPKEAPQKPVSRSRVAIDRRKFPFAVTAYIEKAQRIPEDSSRVRFEIVINDDLDFLPAEYGYVPFNLRGKLGSLPIG